jgi:hypothetical protein
MARMARFLTYGTKAKKKKSLSVHVFLFSLLRHNPKKRAIRAIHNSARHTCNFWTPYRYWHGIGFN